MDGEKITDKSVLAEKLVWVLLRYKDGSEFCFQTTLNSKILREHGVVLEENKLVRLDKKYYMNSKFIFRQFSYVDAKISLWKSLHYTNEESLRIHKYL